MRRRSLGSTDLTVSEIGFGCARIGGVFEDADTGEILRTLRAAFDQGINFFDTADMYTQGQSERLLGRAFARDRERIVIATKAGYCLPAQKRAVAGIRPLVRPIVRRLGIKRESIPSGLKGTITQNFSPNYLIASVEGSLRRLKTDYLDLFQLHSPPTTVLEDGEFLAPLERMQREGKIRYYGVSCETTTDAAVCLRYPGISALQVRMSLLEQTPLSQVLRLADERNVAIIARECFAGGMLAKEPGTQDPDEVTAELEVYHRLAGRIERSLPEVAVQFVLALPGVSVALLGMRTERHLESNLRFARAPSLASSELTSLLARTAA